jgi:hypothetical protein
MAPLNVSSSLRRSTVTPPPQLDRESVMQSTTRTAGVLIAPNTFDRGASVCGSLGCARPAFSVEFAKRIGAQLRNLERHFPEVDTATTVDRTQALIAEFREGNPRFADLATKATRVLCGARQPQDGGESIAANRETTVGNSSFKPLELLERVLLGRAQQDPRDQQNLTHSLVRSLAACVHGEGARWGEGMFAPHLGNVLTGYLPGLRDINEASSRAGLLQNLLTHPQQLGLTPDSTPDEIHQVVLQVGSEALSESPGELHKFKQDLATALYALFDWRAPEGR